MIRVSFLMAGAAVALTACAYSVREVHLPDERLTTFNDPNAKILCPVETRKRTEAVYYRELDPTFDPSFPFPPPAGFEAVSWLVPPKVEYPKELARIDAKEALVTVAAVVAVDGSVKSVQVVCSSDDIFDPYAVGAVRNARFAPAKLDGIAVESTAFVPISWMAKSSLRKASGKN